MDFSIPPSLYHSKSRLSLAARLPFLLVAIVLGATTIFVGVVRLSDQIALNPWEPAIAMEGMRLDAGLPVYDSGHATHLYGPLLTLLLAGVFRVIGLNLLAARVLMSLFSLALAIFLAAILCRTRLVFWPMFAALLFLGINFRTNLVFFSSQPDSIALLLASVGLLVWARGERLVASSLLPSAFFICAMLFKQTAAAIALIPIVFVLMWRRPIVVRELLVSGVPTISILLVLSAIRMFAPAMFQAIVTVPSSIQIHWERAPGILIFLIATFPLFVVGLIAVFSGRRPLAEADRWILSALVMLIPSFFHFLFNLTAHSLFSPFEMVTKNMTRR